MSTESNKSSSDLYNEIIVETRKDMNRAKHAIQELDFSNLEAEHLVAATQWDYVSPYNVQIKAADMVYDLIQECYKGNIQENPLKEEVIRKMMKVSENIVWFTNSYVKNYPDNDELRAIIIAPLAEMQEKQTKLDGGVNRSRKFVQREVEKFEADGILAGNPKKIKENVEDIIEEAKSDMDDYGFPNNFRLETQHYGYDGGFDVMVVCDSLETDKEMKSRISKEVKAMDKEAKRKKDKSERLLDSMTDEEKLELLKTLKANFSESKSKTPEIK